MDVLLLFRYLKKSVLFIAVIPGLYLVVSMQVLSGNAQTPEENILKEAATVRKQKMAAYIKPYKFLYEGNKQDLEKNLKTLDYYKRKLDNEESRRSKKYRKYKKLSERHRELIKLNESVIKELEKGNVIGASESAEKIVEIQRKIEFITKKDSSRKWLTFSEMKSFMKKKYRYKTPDPQILPLRRSNWIVKKTPETESKSKFNYKSKPKKSKNISGRISSK